jgi:(S)-2-hydroxyglutarate dehydrogenase
VANDKRVLIVGGGIVGVATAYRLLERFPDCRVTVVEKEPHVAEHQTGRNSGVIHSGIYYKPGSLKAINCRAGLAQMYEFCQAHSIPHERCGKVIVALSDSELPALERIYERGKANGVDCDYVSREQLLELEPYANGVRAIHVRETGIVNYRRVTERLVQIVQDRGGVVRTGCKAIGMRRAGGESIIQTSCGEFAAESLINCGGLQSDRVAKRMGHKPHAKIVPFRGEYFELAPDAPPLCKNLIYPVPDPNFPFLGVHFTRMIEGGVECGPNAVLAFAREGYTKTTINLRDLFETLTYSGFLRLAFKFWRTGAGEMHRSFSKAAFVKALQRLIPAVRREHLVPHRAGVRAQAVEPNGALVDDFLIEEDESGIHVLNAPSPAATSALNIGLTFVDRAAKRWS